MLTFSVRTIPAILYQVALDRKDKECKAQAT
jgi:hypothetical protein